MPRPKGLGTSKYLIAAPHRGCPLAQSWASVVASPHMFCSVFSLIPHVLSQSVHSGAFRFQSFLFSCLMAYSLRKQPKKDFVSLNEGPPLPADLDDEESHDEFGEDSHEQEDHSDCKDLANLSLD